MAGLGSALSDRARGRGRKRARHGPCGPALHGSPAYRCDWGFVYDVSRPSPYLWRPLGYRECPSVQELLADDEPDRSGNPILVAA
jgi:hypothetical protein